jgi:hypothetical protein
VFLKWEFPKNHPKNHPKLDQFGIETTMVTWESTILRNQYLSITKIRGVIRFYAK